VGTELARVAQSECEMLLDGAEAKAYYGLASNYDSLRALVTLLEEKEVVTGQELDKVFTPNTHPNDIRLKPFTQCVY
jgi:ATP-dependent Zn protease